MLDVTTNQNINCTSSNGIASGSSLIDDDMDPLSENDWLHEHNLDILFDLFEEEMEQKGLDATSSSSSAIFGTSPVTSYLFGTSPSLVSALDLYDLLYFDNQQQQNTNNSTQQQTVSHNPSSTIAPTPITTTTNSTTNNQANNRTVTYNINGVQANKCSTQQGSPNVSINNIASSITNVMRIKRKLKRGQSEGISLLARPLSSNSSTTSCNSSNSNNSSSSSSSNINIDNRGGSSSNNISNINNNNSDKTSTKLTNLKKSIISNNRGSGGIDINQTKFNNNHNRNKHLHHYHHHVHYITGCSVIREHAYAVRGH